MVVFENPRSLKDKSLISSSMILVLYCLKLQIITQDRICQFYFMNNYIETNCKIIMSVYTDLYFLILLCHKKIHEHMITQKGLYLQPVLSPKLDNYIITSIDHSHKNTIFFYEITITMHLEIFLYNEEHQVIWKLQNQVL